MSVAGYQKVINVKATSTTSSTAYRVFPGTNATLNAAGDDLDDTDFRSTGYRSHLVGLLDWGVDITSNYEPSLTAFQTVRNAWRNRTRVDIQYLADGTNGYQGTGWVTTFSHSGDVGGLETVDVNVVADTALSTA
jgi:hypothetical protein